MKGKIDKNGKLWLWRGNKYKIQECPIHGLTYNCGDWCPLFCEPEADTIEKIELDLCHSFHLFDKENFIDERGQ